MSGIGETEGGRARARSNPSDCTPGDALPVARDGVTSQTMIMVPVRNSRSSVLNEGWLLAINKVGSQLDLAKRLGIDQSEVSRYAANLRKCSPRLAMRLDVELGVPRWLTRPDLFEAPAIDGEDGG